MNVVVPIAGNGAAFARAGYTFPKPLIDIQGKSMIEIVARNLSTGSDNLRFVFICRGEDVAKYDLYHILQFATGNRFEIVTLGQPTQGAACTVLTAIQHINSDQPLVIANGDQYLEGGISEFLAEATASRVDGSIVTFPASHPRWSYARVDDSGRVLETAEKRVISKHATAGVYYFKRGRDFVAAAESMIKKNITHNGEFYVCPVFNELILEGKIVQSWEIPSERMHSLGTPEDLRNYTELLKVGGLKI